MCESVTQESKLFDYQKEVADYRGKTLICNWARCLGKTWTIAHIIKDNKPRNVLYAINTMRLIELKRKLDEVQKFYTDMYHESPFKRIKYEKDIIEVIHNDNSMTEIYLYEKDLILNKVGYDIPFNYIIFDGLLPFEIGFITINAISFVHINNYNKMLQKLYLQHKIMELDYTKGLEFRIITKEFINKNKNSDWWYNEMAILDNPAIKIDNAEFLYSTLHNLQEEYKKLEGSKDTVLTRKNLLEMITRLYQQLNISTSK